MSAILTANSELKLILTPVNKFQRLQYRKWRKQSIQQQICLCKTPALLSKIITRDLTYTKDKNPLREICSTLDDEIFDDTLSCT